MFEWHAAGYFSNSLLLAQTKPETFVPLGAIIGLRGGISPFVPMPSAGHSQDPLPMHHSPSPYGSAGKSFVPYMGPLVSQALYIYAIRVQGTYPPYDAEPVTRTQQAVGDMGWLTGPAPPLLHRFRHHKCTWVRICSSLLKLPKTSYPHRELRTSWKRLFRICFPKRLSSLLMGGMC